jgi:transposase
MKATQATVGENSTSVKVLYMALELSNKEWKIAFGDGRRERRRSIDAGELRGLEEEIRKGKESFGLGNEAGVVSCYEAGRDGFWLHRYLESCGVENFVVDPSSIEVDRRRRRAKTDRLDAGKLLRMLLRYCWGERKAWSVLRVPGVEEEDGRHLHRELETLKRERTMHCNRIRGLLKLHGVDIEHPRRGISWSIWKVCVFGTAARFRLG